MEDQQVQIVKNILAGGVAGLVSRTAVAPLERAKIILQLQSTNKSLSQVFTSMHRERLGLFKGNGTNLLRIMPYSAVQFAVYEGTKKAFDLENETVKRLVCGGLAGMASVICTYPLDLVRTRLSMPNQANHHGILKMLKTVYQQEGGLLAWYKGLLPTLIVPVFS